MPSKSKAQARMMAAAALWPLERLAAKGVRNDNGCLLWLGGKDGRGYGSINIHGDIIKVHRLSYFLSTEEFPENHVLHKCDTPLCFEPTHLFPGTDLDNVRDMDAKGRRVNTPSFINQNTFKKICVNGHSLSADNVYVCPRGRRLCRACNRQRTRVYYAKQKQSSS
jgi:hypothetical protein